MHFIIWILWGHAALFDFMYGQNWPWGYLVWLEVGDSTAPFWCVYKIECHFVLKLLNIILGMISEKKCCLKNLSKIFVLFFHNSIIHRIGMHAKLSWRTSGVSSNCFHSIQKSHNSSKVREMANYCTYTHLFKLLYF